MTRLWNWTRISQKTGKLFSTQNVGERTQQATRENMDCLSIQDEKIAPYLIRCLTVSVQIRFRRGMVLQCVLKCDALTATIRNIRVCCSVLMCVAVC